LKVQYKLLILIAVLTLLSSFASAETLLQDDFEVAGNQGQWSTYSCTEETTINPSGSTRSLLLSSSGCLQNLTIPPATTGYTNVIFDYYMKTGQGANDPYIRFLDSSSLIWAVEGGDNGPYTLGAYDGAAWVLIEGSYAKDQWVNLNMVYDDVNNNCSYILTNVTDTIESYEDDCTYAGNEGFLKQLVFGNQGTAGTYIDNMQICDGVCEVVDNPPTNSSWNVTSANVFVGENTATWNSGGVINISSDLLSLTVTTDIASNGSCNIGNDWNYTTMVANNSNYKFATTDVTSHAYTIYDDFSAGSQCIYCAFISSDGLETTTSTSGCLNTTLWTYPSVSLDLPTDTYTDDNGTINFTYTPSIEYGPIVNCSLYGNWSGSWIQNQTNISAVSNGSTNWFDTISLSDGDYIWNVKCSNEKGMSNFSSSNYTLTVKISVDDSPNVTLNKPDDDSTIMYYTQKDNGIVFNFSVADDNYVDNCSLWHNASGTFSLNQTIYYSGNVIQKQVNSSSVTLQGKKIESGPGWSYFSMTMDKGGDTGWVDLDIYAGGCIACSYSLVDYTDEYSISFAAGNKIMLTANGNYDGETWVKFNATDAVGGGSSSYVIPVTETTYLQAINDSSMETYVNISAEANYTFNLYYYPPENYGYSSGITLKYGYTPSTVAYSLSESCTQTNPIHIKAEVLHATTSEYNFFCETSSGYESLGQDTVAGDGRLYGANLTHYLKIVNDTNYNFEPTIFSNENIINWNVECYDNFSQSDWGINRTLYINNSVPTWTANISNVTINRLSGTTVYLQNLSDYISNLDSDTITFSIQSENLSEVNCAISGDNLSITPYDYWYGNASCIVGINDSYDYGENRTIGIEVLAVDILNPIITLITPSNNSRTVGTNTELRYNITDDSIISNCSLYVNGTLNQTDNTITKNIPQSFFLTTNEGNYYLWNITCRDYYNNSNASEVRNFNVNTPPTAPALISPSNTSYVGGSTTLIDWNASSDTDGDSLDYYIWYSQSANPSYLSYTANTQEYVDSSSTGTYYWYVKAYDNYEFSNSSGTFYFTTSLDPPVLSKIAPTIVLTDDSSILFNVSVTDDNLDTANTKINLGGTWYYLNDYTSSGNTYYFYRTISSLTEQNYSYYFTAINNEGVLGSTDLSYVKVNYTANIDLDYTASMGPYNSIHWKPATGYNITYVAPDGMSLINYTFAIQNNDATRNGEVLLKVDSTESGYDLCCNDKYDNTSCMGINTSYQVINKTLVPSDTCNIWCWINYTNPINIWNFNFGINLKGS